MALAGDDVVGFHTLVVAEVSPEHAPDRIRKGLARHPDPPHLFVLLKELQGIAGAQRTDKELIQPLGNQPPSLRQNVGMALGREQGWIRGDALLREGLIAVFGDQLRGRR